MKTTVMVIGAIVLLLGIIGFFNNPVLGIFPVNTLHNLVNLAAGLLLVWFATRGPAGASMISKALGVVFAIVAILDFVIPATMASLLAVDIADSWLHVILAIILLWVGFGMKPKSSM